MKNPIENRTLFTGDNLEVMRAMNSETVDLIYLDPPFNKKFVFPIGKGDGAEFGFKDIWGWESAPDETNPFLPYAELYAYDELLAAAANGNPLIDEPMARKIVRLLETIGEISGHAEMAYLSFMAARLVEMRRLLKPTGSIYLHCDPTMSHSLKLLMDVVFGGENFRNEIVWNYDKWANTASYFQRNHDILFFYVKENKKYTFNKLTGGMTERMLRERSRGYITKTTSGENRRLLIVYNKKDARAQTKIKEGNYDQLYYVNPNKGGIRIKDVWDISILGSVSKERTGYPTQKPLALLERIITASSNEGGLVLDPFCGCATTCIAAEKLNRQWLGIDVASQAANLVSKRLLDETKQGKLGGKVPQIHHRRFDKGDCPLRTDLGETKSKNIKQILYGVQEGRCKLCKNHMAIQYFHLDHITPKAKGGPDCDRNLQLLCAPCNTVKSTRTMEKARQRLRELGYV